MSAYPFPVAAGIERMISSILASEPLLRLTLGLTVAALLVMWERRRPSAAVQPSPHHRTANNLLLMVLNSLIARAFIPVTAAGFAAGLEPAGSGLLNQLSLPFWLKVLMAVVLLDLAIWLQHWLFHVVPWLWRLHRVHHADLHVDWTTGVRFHPLEHLISLGIKLVVVALLGAPALAVICFEVLLNATSMFNHANGRMPESLDRALRWILVTPSLHRIHHSTDPAEQRCNFGFNLTLWDRLFRRLLAPEIRGSRPLVQGIAELQEPHQTEPMRQLLTLPFRPLGPATGSTTL
jgi:sterol desaturase/sphingolipid hydroxylase (fatty acid hydroxylase superfamily)